MIRDNLVSLLAGRLGNRTDLTDRIILEMQLVQESILEGTGAFLPWFLETELSAVLTVVGESRVPLPTDFLGQIEEAPLFLYDASWDEPFAKLGKDDEGVIRVRYPGSGKPRAYALTADYFVLAPIPDAAYELKMRYYARDAVLTTNIENKWLKHAPDLVIAEVGAVMAKHLQNDAMEASFRNDALTARSRLYTNHEARAHTGRKYQMGDD